MEALLKYQAAPTQKESKHKIERSEQIKTDLFNRFAIILAVRELKIWRVQSEETAIVSLQVYPGEPHEYKFLRREVKKRLEQRFNICNVIIELDW